jgi:hypothetical protein
MRREAVGGEVVVDLFFEVEEFLERDVEEIARAASKVGHADALEPV